MRAWVCLGLLLWGCGDKDDDDDVTPTDPTGDTDDTGDTEIGTFQTISQQQELPPGDLCRYGGSRFMEGKDDGANGAIRGNGILEAGETSEWFYVCNEEPPALYDGPGLDGRVIFQGCAPGPDSDVEGVRLELMYDNLELDQPVGLIFDDTSDHWFVLEKFGTIGRFAKDDPTSKGIVLDISDQVQVSYEAGMLGLALHPDWPETDEIYVTYNTEEGTDWGDTVIRLSRFSGFDLANGGFDESTEEVILEIEQIIEEHNGGHIQFMADGTLLMSVGDGGDFTAADDRFSLSSKFLRIDVDNPDPNQLYGIPDDNPDMGGQRGEVWATGFRNPWQWDIDDVTGEVWAGDVGLVTWEEVNKVTPGGHHGWPWVEGIGCRDLSNDMVDYSASCDIETYEAPTYAYPHHQGCAVTMGKVYRGSDFPWLQGSPVFADFCQGMVWYLDSNDRRQFLLDTSLNVGTFAEDDEGELYLVDLYKGEIHKMVPHDGALPPEWLSQTGCVDPDDPTQPLPSAIPYRPNAPFFTHLDTEKSRWMLIPRQERIYVRDNGGWIFPTGSVLMKRFDVVGQPIEMRIMWRQEDGDWLSQSYRYELDGSDAYRVDQTEVFTTPSNHDWTIPDRGGCNHCHSIAGGRPAGVGQQQVHGAIWYPSTGRWADQATTLAELGLLNTTDYLESDPLVDPYDDSEPLELRAMSWLHTNCSTCHQPGGGGYGGADYRYKPDEGVAGMKKCGQYPLAADMFLDDPRVIDPGNKENSVLWQRLRRSDEYRMPPYLHVPDPLASNLIGQWIDSLEDCGDAPAP